jgi:hypothetical protein
MAPSRDSERAEKTKFIRDVVPYLKLARALDQEPLFLDRFFTLWFVHWPIQLKDFADDKDWLDLKIIMEKKVRPDPNQLKIDY